MNGTGITDTARADFDTCLAGADEDGALELATGLVTSGVNAEDVLLGLVAPAQVRVGERWESGEWTVAQEHAATHVSRLTVDAIASTARTVRTPAEAGPPRHVLVACSDGEWHVLPSHILTEVLRLRGFHVRSLGGSVSPHELLSDVHQNGPDVVALSCTLSWNLPLAHRQIETCRCAGVPVMTGGPGFGPDGTWAYALGADLYAADARGAAEALLHPWPPVTCGESSVQAGAVEAYAVLVRQRPELLAHVTHALRDVLPGLRNRSGMEHEEAADFLGRLLDSLAAAVFVDDERVFTGHLAFAATYLSARSVDPRCLLTLTDALTARLRGAPRALTTLAAGRRCLIERGASRSHE
ncbi:cobalamin B12-binding domain-containing protein [Streptomyces violaceusniger]|uniref:Cobalamin B12-binding domain protein n=1 Tax=Streptomyces violaceusniger (strain Tu 4113) TaxID=653045 RepID=G2PBR8_STRV4|nr:cobalamin-dependent protein [Streptomyces violaceusniger]AEM80990.1 cobalamin B12-binding domain protein [Streptomyces violaceusniger Tu 4113]